LPDRSRSWVIAAVAILGVAAGFAASGIAYHYRWLGGRRAPFIDRMQRELSLTPEQHAQILQIINDTRSKVMSLREEFQNQRRAQIKQARARVRALLTPAQQEKFDREFRPRHEHERSYPGGPSPPNG
jgi:Spy/CpxP family protein refolding chaperone